MEEKIFLEGLCLWYHPSLQGTICLKIAAEAQEYGVKTVQD